MDKKTRKELNKYQKRINEKGLKINAFEVFKNYKKGGKPMWGWSDDVIVKDLKQLFNFEHDIDLTDRQLKKKNKAFKKLLCLYKSKDNGLEAELQCLFRYFYIRVKLVGMSLKLIEIFFPHYMKGMNKS